MQPPSATQHLEAGLEVANMIKRTERQLKSSTFIGTNTDSMSQRVNKPKKGLKWPEFNTKRPKTHEKMEASEK